MDLRRLVHNCVLLLCCFAATERFLFSSTMAGGPEWKHVETSGSSETVCKYAAMHLQFEIAGDPFDLLESPAHFKFLEKNDIASVYELTPSSTNFHVFASVHLPKAPNTQLLIADKGKRSNLSVTGPASFDRAASIHWHDQDGIILFGYASDKRFDISQDPASELWRRKSRSMLGHFFLKFEHDNRTYFIDRSVGHETAYIFSLNGELVPQGHCFFQAP